MTLVYRMCRYSGEVLPVSDFTLDRFECDRVCQQAPAGPKAQPPEQSYVVRALTPEEQEWADRGWDPRDEPAWQALFHALDPAGTGLVSEGALVRYLEDGVGPFHYQGGGDAELDFEEFLYAVNNWVPPGAGMKARLLAHGLLNGRDPQECRADLITTPSTRGGYMAQLGGANLNPDDQHALMKLFNHLDPDHSGLVQRQASEGALHELLGTFEWADDTPETLNLVDFLDAMRLVNPTARIGAILFAKNKLVV